MRKLDVDPPWDNDASSMSHKTNKGSIVQTCGNTNVHVLTQIYVDTYLNVYELHKKADLSMCTARMPLPSCSHKPNATIILKNSK